MWEVREGGGETSFEKSIAHLEKCMNIRVTILHCFNCYVLIFFGGGSTFELLSKKHAKVDQGLELSLFFTREFEDKSRNNLGKHINT